MSWPMIHGGAGQPRSSVRLSLRMIAPIQGCLVDRHLIGSPIATLPLGRESRALRFEPFQGLSGLNAGGSSGAGIAGAVEVYEGAAGPAEVDGRVDGAAVCAP